jgi:glyoxylase-like metal-dependent hydrolase (beta-lactamase superfamily II)
VKPIVTSFFDANTSTISHVVYDEAGGRAAIVDPVLSFDAASGLTSTNAILPIITFVKEKGLSVDWILETHAHADHLSGAPYLRDTLGGKIGIGANIVKVQSTFKELLNLDAKFQGDGSEFDHLFVDGETFSIGTLGATALEMPGHTPADLAFQVGDCVFVGDTLFMPDVGTARCDFPGGDAPALYRSIRRLLSMPVDTKLYLCHDYPPPDREPAWVVTVGEERKANIHVHDGVSLEAFVDMREARDKTLGMPHLMWPSIQVNIRAGKLPAAEANGRHYLKIPIGPG